MVPMKDSAVSAPVTPVLGRSEKKIQKLDGNAYKPFGSRSRSSSDAGSDTTYCRGGPGNVCGEPVRESTLTSLRRGFRRLSRKSLTFL